MRAAGTVRPIATATANIENSTTTTPSANRFCPDVGGSVANTNSGSTTLRGANNASVLRQGYRPTNLSSIESKLLGVWSFHRKILP